MKDFFLKNELKKNLKS